MKRPWDRNKLDVFKEQKVGPSARAEEERKQCQVKCRSHHDDELNLSPPPNMQWKSTRNF